MISDKEEGPWPDWEGSGFPREYGIDEKVPLQEPGIELGMGRFGDVDLVRCGKIELARKRIRVNARLQEYLRDGSHETRIMRKLRHEHIVRFAGSYIQGNTLGILVSPVAACNLGQLLHAGVSQYPDPTDTESCRVWDLLQLDSYHFEESRPDGTVRGGPRRGHIILRRMFGCIAAALDYLHEQGIRHKDIKPDNILATRNSVYLSDFGVSTDVSRLIQDQGFSMTEGPTAGTARYFSPEAAKYLPRGRKSDIFSLGCVFLEMLAVLSGMPLSAINLRFTGEREPITGMRYYEHINDISRLLSEIQARPGSGTIPGDLCAMLLEMLQEDPERRPSAATVVESLASYQSELAVVHCLQCAKPAILFANKRRSLVNYSDFELVVHHLPRYWWFAFAVHFLSCPREWLILETLISMTSFSTPIVPPGYAYFAIDLAVLGISERAFQTLCITPTLTCSIRNYCFTQARSWLSILLQYIVSSFWYALYSGLDNTFDWACVTWSNINYYFTQAMSWISTLQHVVDTSWNALHSALDNAFEWPSSLASTTVVSAPSLVYSTLSIIGTVLSSAIAIALPPLKAPQRFIYTAMSALDRFLCALDSLDPCPDPQEWRAQVHQFYLPVASETQVYAVAFLILGLILLSGLAFLSLRLEANNSVDGSPSSTEFFFVYFFLVHFLGGLVWIVGFVVVGVVFMIHWVVSQFIGSGVALLSI
jgi:serine/threonine protein kinase